MARERRGCGAESSDGAELGTRSGSPSVMSNVVKVFNQLSSASSGDAGAPHLHTHDGVGYHSHDHAAAEHGHTHEHLDHPGL